MISSHDEGDVVKETILCDEELALEDKCRVLRSQIRAIRERRSQIKRATDKVTKSASEWASYRNRAEQDLSAAVATFKSAAMSNQTAMASLEVARNLSPTVDCFYIWHRGPFGTINGLRLGSEAPSLPPSVSTDDDSVANSAKPDFDLSSLISQAPVSSSDPSNAAVGGKSTNETIKVPWPEINAALGMAALLLSTLEKKPHSGIKFKNEILPMGNFSKIGIAQTDGRPPVLFNLHYSEDSFQFFGKRNFNTALDGLFHCLKDASDAVSRIDKATALPHKVEVSPQGEVTIGGIPVTYGDNGEVWTKAMKYFLTDLKWLLAFTTKNADR
uniref:Atg6 BARA domain-containing protein n=1 Tax=Trieres chinensis TaxID=1514140 RepID=A0A7S2A6K8_TRICV|mmetsp:Transcript_4550/g.9607  ORF Transcript_4550/g.9607 Transcript_4550/m.9607 type:complete len:329 (+) Transcript_4550:88-1074(+)